MKGFIELNTPNGVLLLNTRRISTVQQVPQGVMITMDNDVPFAIPSGDPGQLAEEIKRKIYESK